jgi:hypothetical protein
VGLALVTRIPSLAEAQIAAGALRSGGIEAVVFEGLGGYRIMAPEEDVAEARASLKALRSNPGLAIEAYDSPWESATAGRFRWQTKGMRIVGVLFLAAPMLVWLLLRALG